MATGRNTSRFKLPITVSSGNAIAYGDVDDVDPGDAGDAGLIASGEITVVDADAEPIAPPAIIVPVQARVDYEQRPQPFLLDVREGEPGTDAIGVDGLPIAVGGSGGSATGVILPWVTATPYLAGQPVTNGGQTYTANDAHTSGATFAGDLAGHWTLLPVGGGSGIDPADFADGQVAVYDADLEKLVGGQLLNPSTRLKTFALTGDSITESNNGLNDDGGDYSTPFFGGYSVGRAWFHWADNYLGGRLRLIASFGVGSQSTTQIAARFDADMLSVNPRPDAFIIAGGTNDLRYGGGDPAAAAANLIAMAEKVIAVGKQAIIMSIPPFNADVVTANNLLRAYVKTRPVLFCDSYDDLVGGDGKLLPIYDNDPDAGDVQHVHPSPEACRVIGRKLADLLAPVTEPDDSILVTDANDPLQLVLNPFLTGDVGGGVPTSWQNGGVGAGVTRSKVARTDGFGEWVQFAYPPDGASVVESAFQQVSGTLDAKVIAGRIYRLAVEVEGEDWYEVENVGFGGQFVAPGGVSFGSMQLTNYNASKRIFGPDGRLVITTPPITAPASLSFLYLVVRVKAMRGTFRFGRVCMYEVETRYPFARRQR